MTFKPENDGLRKFFGSLEADIMEIIWTQGPLTAKRAQYFLGKKREYAYTTVMTVLNRLTEKAFLTRLKQGHAFIYSPATDKNKFLSEYIGLIMNSLMTDYDEIVSRAFYKVRESHRNRPAPASPDKEKKKKF